MLCWSQTAHCNGQSVIRVVTGQLASRRMGHGSPARLSVPRALGFLDASRTSRD